MKGIPLLSEVDLGDGRVMLVPTSIRSYDPVKVSDETAVDTGEETKVQQQFKEETDVVNIVRRFGIGNPMPLRRGVAYYGDFTGIDGYKDAVDRIDRAHEAFMTLPPQAREMFENDPGKLIAFAESVGEAAFVKALGLEGPVPPEAAPAAGGVTPGAAGDS